MRAFPLLACLLLCSCGPKHAIKGVTYFVGPECHPVAYEIGCDLHSPPECKLIRLKYDKGCEKLVAH